MHLGVLDQIASLGFEHSTASMHSPLQTPYNVACCTLRSASWCPPSCHQTAADSSARALPDSYAVSTGKGFQRQQLQDPLRPPAAAAATLAMGRNRQPAQNVGIRALYVYFPRMMVQQQDLEAADSCPGKYTVGLGQQAMTFCGDREDVVSMAATAMLQLLEGSGLQATDIGRLEVGTETGVDRSKSVMSYLVGYLNHAGNYSVQGCDHMHGCYGGTSALLTVADWVASPSWDGRLGLVVATDIAVYPPASPARPTGGCGAAALLVGPDAPLVLEPWPWRSSFSAHTYDFFKPHGHPLYPVVDGPATLLWFTKAADAAAAQLHSQLQQQGELPASQQQQEQQEQQEQQKQQPAGLLDCYDYFLSHSPYNKIVRKVFGRLVLQDALRAKQTSQLQHVQQQLVAASSANGTPQSTPGSPHSTTSRSRPPLPPLPPEAASLLDLPPGPLPDSSITDKALERALLAASKPLFEAMASQGAALQCQLGNLYTASLYSGLASLVAQQGQQLVGKRVLCFSFGSGAVASMFTLTGRDCSGSSTAGDQQQQQQYSWSNAPCSLQSMADQLVLPQRLAARQQRSVADFDAAMSSLRAAYNSAPYSPSYGQLDDLAPSTVHLTAIDAGFKRSYSRRPQS